MDSLITHTFPFHLLDVWIIPFPRSLGHFLMFSTTLFAQDVESVRVKAKLAFKCFILIEFRFRDTKEADFHTETMGCTYFCT